MNQYQKKYGFRNPQIADVPDPNLDLIVVIPCFNEQQVIRSIKSLFNAQKPACAVEIIVVVNCSENATQEVREVNNKAILDLHEFAQHHNKREFKLYVISEQNLPKKHAGVGLARKIGMDEAYYRFNSLNKNGIILCFDADSECSKNYLTEIFEQFKRTNFNGAAIHFEHPVQGKEFDHEVYKAIISYELHLRYYKQCFTFCGLPYDFHTVGSSMAVASNAYAKQGGMNKRKAGEDFYFLHKIIALGNFIEINNASVYPSPRISNRVPFGTGKAVGEIIALEGNYSTYNFNIFKEIKAITTFLPTIYETNSFDSLNLSGTSKRYLKQVDFERSINEIKNNTANLNSFKKRFYNYFNAFFILKMVHFLRDNEFPNEPLSKSILALLESNKIVTTETNEKELLFLLRRIDRSRNFA